MGPPRSWVILLPGIGHAKPRSSGFDSVPVTKLVFLPSRCWQGSVLDRVPALPQGSTWGRSRSHNKLLNWPLVWKSVG